DRPQRLDAPLPYRDIPVVQIDRRIAMTGNEQHLVAEAKRRRARAQLELAMLVGGTDHFHVVATVHPRQPLLRAVSFEAGVDDCALAHRHAHHRREHEKAVLELRIALAAGPADPCVFGVHEHVRSALQLVPEPALAFDAKRSRSRAGDDAAVESRAGDRRERLADRLGSTCDRALARLDTWEVLRSAVVSLQTAKLEARSIRDSSRKIARGCSRRNPATLHADFDFDETADRHAELRGRTRRRLDLFDRVEAEPDRRFGTERRKPAELRHTDHLVAHQHVAYAAADERLGLADLLAALADGARGDLAQRDRR